MGKLGFVGHLATCMVLFWLASCAADPATTAGAGERAPSAVMPATLRMTALRAMQQAPGYDFERLAARIGAMGSESWVEIAGERVAITPSTGGHAFGLRTVYVGRRRSGPDAARALGVLREVHAEGQEAVLERAGIEERYLAGPMGLEQSYRIEARPEGRGPLAIEVGFEGLRPEPVAGAENMVALVDEGGVRTAVYRDLAAVDAEGRELGAHIEVAGSGVTLVVEDEGAAYPVVVDPLVATEQAEISASDSAENDQFGLSVSVSGDTALVGAPAYLSNTGALGAAYVFVRSGTSWAQQAELLASATDVGRSVSVSGDTALVGASGAAYVFVRSGTSWTEQAKLLASEVWVLGFGDSVSVSGDTALVGAPGNPGAAYVFVRSGTSWVQEAELVVGDGALPAYFGVSVSLSGDTALVGASDDASSTGAAYVFARSGTSWVQEAKLLAGDGAGGDYFGNSVSVSGDTALIGAFGKASGTGAAYVFARSGTSWVQEAKLLAGDGAVHDYFGGSVSVSGDTALVGGWRKADYTGAAYIFARTGTSWVQEAKLLAGDGAGGDLFGDSVSLSGDSALIGAPDRAYNTGAAYVFVLQKTQGDPCTSAAECASGFCVSGVCCDTACNTGTCQGGTCSEGTGGAGGAPSAHGGGGHTGTEPITFGGCGCEVAGSDAPSSFAWLALLALPAIRRRR